MGLFVGHMSIDRTHNSGEGKFNCTLKLPVCRFYSTRRKQAMLRQFNAIRDMDRLYYVPFQYMTKRLSCANAFIKYKIHIREQFIICILGIVS
jgi:hypothetical protein